MKKLLSLLFSGLLVISGCVKHSLDDAGGAMSDLTFMLASSAPANGDSGTRSSYGTSPTDKITDFTIFVFDAGGNSVSANYYQGDANMSGRALFINEALNTTFSDAFDVYIIANLGDLRTNGEICNAGVPDMRKLEDYSYGFSDDLEEFETKGFPMAGYYRSYRPASDSRTLYADKLVTQYNIHFTKSPGNPNTYTITGGRLGNVAVRCTPFKTFKASSARDISGSGDSFSYGDISSLNGAGSASLFVLENEQGNVFPSSVNSGKLRKMESFPSGSIYRQICTYVEFDFTVATPTATYENVTYRYFFGDALWDCSVHRNMVYNLTLNFDNVLVEDEGWRIEPGDPVVDESALSLDRTQLSIIKGMSNTLTVTKNAGVTYEMTYSQADAAAYGVTISKSSWGNVDTYTFSTSYTPVVSGSAIPKVSYADIPVTFTTSDGLVTKDFVIRVNKNPVLLEYSFRDGLGSVEVSSTVDWPAGTTFETSVTGILYGENQYCNNRVLGRYSCDVWQSFLGVYPSSSYLDEGDAASDDFQTIDLGTDEIRTAMHELNMSHPTEHHYAVGATEVHYTTVGHAYLKVNHAIVIDGSVAAVPVMIIESGSPRAGSTYRTDEDGSSTYVSVYAQRVPAWRYEPSVTTNSAADNYIDGYIRVNEEYEVSLQKKNVVNGSPVAYLKGDLYALNVEGAPRDSYDLWTGIDFIYGLPDTVSY
ncbi:MAG: hypothetical protein J5639_03180 [Bacteroidales bacterium]|nr:hypothetical protein [Bacteroidales bacterium]